MHECTQEQNLKRIANLIDGNGQPGLVKQTERNATMISEIQKDIRYTLAIWYTSDINLIYK